MLVGISKTQDAEWLINLNKNGIVGSYLHSERFLILQGSKKEVTVSTVSENVTLAIPSITMSA